MGRVEKLDGWPSACWSGASDGLDQKSTQQERDGDRCGSEECTIALVFHPAVRRSVGEGSTVAHKVDPAVAGHKLE